MKTVLIALDYDPTAEKVAEAGAALAKALDAKIILLHVIAEPAYYSSTAYAPVMGFGGYVDLNFMEPDIIDNLKKASEDFLNRSKEHLDDSAIETLVKEGDIPDCIIAAAKEQSADVIVIGSHSRKWLESIVMGSVTEKVLHHTTTPLFIIPTKKEA
ncbi:universal stress protein [Ferruginibacter sp. SUN106]|uniref:universal stress protein n=1 Tax=Ferruginibacter sp. SUN106 TaxID=2978348 RepID=UPI003D35A169